MALITLHASIPSGISSDEKHLVAAELSVCFTDVEINGTSVTVPNLCNKTAEAVYQQLVDIGLTRIEEEVVPDEALPRVYGDEEIEDN